MAEPTQPVIAIRTGGSEDSVRPGRFAPYRAVLASRARAQRSYRASFRLDLVSSALVAVVELAEVLVLYRSVSALGGLSLAQVLLVFGLADVGFSLASLGFGHVDDLPEHLRRGTIDVFYLRPQPVLAQLVTSDINLRRLARAAVGLAALVVGLIVAGVPATWRSAALVLLAVVCGTTISSALYVAAGGLQFLVIDGAEMTNSFVYGGRYAATQPATVWVAPVRAIFGYLVPVTFCGYLPVLAMLRLPAPGWLPAWLAWCAPLAAVWAWGLALACWRWGSRRYQGAGG